MPKLPANWIVCKSFRFLNLLFQSWKCLPLLRHLKIGFSPGLVVFRKKIIKSNVDQLSYLKRSRWRFRNNSRIICDLVIQFIFPIQRNCVNSTFFLSISTTLNFSPLNSKIISHKNKNVISSTSTSFTVQWNNVATINGDCLIKINMQQCFHVFSNVNPCHTENIVHLVNYCQFSAKLK